MAIEQRPSNPKTLFEIANAVQPEFTWSNSVLIIIDAQREYENGVLPLPKIQQTVDVIKKLLLEARKRGTPVIHVVHEGAKGLFDPESEGFKIIEKLTPEKGEIVLRKQLPNAFANTKLKTILSSLGINKNLILVGYMTHMCITATAMAAVDLGYQSFVVRDAVATRALTGADGQIISDSQVNDSALAALKDRISWIVESKKLLED